MGKTSKWLKSILTGKKDKEKGKSNNQTSPSPISVTENPSTPVTSILPSTPKEKRRWSFRRSSATAASVPKESHPTESAPTATATATATATPSTTHPVTVLQANNNNNTVESEDEQKKHAIAVAAATAAAADAAVAAAQAAVAVIRLTSNAPNGKPGATEEIAAAVKIQAVFRGYLARKALCALKGLVKLQALVRGHLVRKQAKVTLRCMQALVTVQARARAQRLRLTPDDTNQFNQRIHRKSTQENRFRPTYPDYDKGMEENIKIVEMDIGESVPSSRNRHSYSNHSYYASNGAFSKQEYHRDLSPAPSALTEMSPRASSGHFDEYSFSTAQSSPQYYSATSKVDPSRTPLAFLRPDYAESLSYDHPLYPSYMANTESSRAKARSQSAPKSRPADSIERQPSRRRASMEGRNIPRAMRMQRSSSQVGATCGQSNQYPWSIKLDRSTVSLKDSECGSTSTVLTNATYLQSLVAYDHHGNRY